MFRPVDARRISDHVFEIIDERQGLEVWITVPDAKAPCPLERVSWQFKADRPNQLWVSDFTYVLTWQGMIFVAFAVDVYGRFIVGWRVSSSMRTDFALDALCRSQSVLLGQATLIPVGAARHKNT